METSGDSTWKWRSRRSLAAIKLFHGKTDEALDVLNQLVERYPDTPYIDEVQFRRGEMLFLRKNYNDAETAYTDVVEFGAESRFYEQSLYKLGWSQFKLAWHEDSLGSFFELLDRKVGDIEIQDGDNKFEELSRANQELVEELIRCGQSAATSSFIQACMNLPVSLGPP